MTNAKIIRLNAHKRAKQPDESVPLNPIDLSFVRRLKGGCNFGAIKPTGQYGNDCLTGKKLAYEYLEFLATGRAFPLQWILEDMRHQQHNGIEVGFLSTVTNVAAFGAHIAGDRLREIHP